MTALEQHGWPSLSTVHDCGASSSHGTAERHLACASAPATAMLRITTMRGCAHDSSYDDTITGITTERPRRLPATISHGPILPGCHEAQASTHSLFECGQSRATRRPRMPRHIPYPPPLRQRSRETSAIEMPNYVFLSVAPPQPSPLTPSDANAHVSAEHLIVPPEATDD